MLTLDDLVRNRTMSPGMAATLAAAAEERRSLLFVAIPRMAGKTTTMGATLQYAPPGTRAHRVTRAKGPQLGIPAEGDGGYLVMSEIAQTPFDDYLWGADVQQVFGALERGFSLATALHAPGLHEAFEIITGRNEISDEQAARIDIMVYIRSVGHWAEPTRRAVEAIYEIEGVRNGRPEGLLLHRWSEEKDRFEEVAEPMRVGRETGAFAKHQEAFASVT